MSLASSHFTIAHGHAASFLGATVGVMRPHDIDFVDASNVIVGNERAELVEPSEGGSNYVKTRDLVIKVEDIPGDIARGDLLFEIDGDRYATEDFNKIDGGYASYKVRRVEAREIARKGYRGGR